MKHVVLVLLLVAPPAHSYVPVTTDSGIPVAWTSDVVEFEVDQFLPPGWDAGLVGQLIDAASAPWESLECHPLSIERIGWTDQAVADLFDRKNNILWIQDEWPYSQTMMAITLIEYNNFTGELRDAEILINNDQKSFDRAGACDPQSLNYDLVNILTHEFGHVVGLDHSAELQATMHLETFEGDCLKRSLHQDDIDGFCASYAPDVTAPESEDASGDLASAEQADGGSGDGCTCAASPKTSPGAAPWLVALALVLGLRIRKRA